MLDRENQNENAPPPPPSPDEGDGEEQQRNANGMRMTRRRLLQYGALAGAMAAFTACTRAPDRLAIPFLVQPEEVVPGKALWYATTCHGCAAQCGMLAKVRDGRPIKLEGAPEHPLSGGGLCAIGQAQVRSLYDADRLGEPRLGGDRATFTAFDAYVREKLTSLRGENKPVALVTPSLSSPTTRALMAELLEAYPNVEHVTYDAPSHSAIREAHRLAYGEPRLPSYRFDRARLILGVEADFLGTWLNPVAYARQYAAARDPKREGGMARHVQLESHLSLTGSRADMRLLATPSQVGAALANLVDRVATLRNKPRPWSEPPQTSLPAAKLDKLAQDLADHAGNALVVCGINDPKLQLLVAALNDLLGSVGENRPVEWHRPQQSALGDDAAFHDVLERAVVGELGGMIFWDVNPAYDHPRGEQLVEALPKLKLTAALATHYDETAAAVHAVAPLPHFLETWDDGEPQAGLLTLTQPTLQPLFGARPGPEALMRWLGDNDGSYRDKLRERWRREVYPQVKASAAHNEREAGNDYGARFAFKQFWTEALQRGHVQVAPRPEALPELRRDALPQASAFAQRDNGNGNGMELVAYHTIALGNGKHANNPWLLECPEPVSKVAWDNFAALHPDTAARLGVRDDRLVRVSVPGGASVTLPALIMPGVHRNVVAVALGYGRRKAGRFGEQVGVNVAPLLQANDGLHLGYHGTPVNVAAQAGTHKLARTQIYHRQVEPYTNYDRYFIGEATYEAYQEDNAAGRPKQYPPKSMYPERDYPGMKWAMVVDLSRCIGCSACVISCQAENNIPVVGRDEVRRNREMHWMRIDRYYIDEQDDETLHVGYQPMMCQHCDHAPCENVCPVVATTHSREGLNEQVYNRCVGTRYCANNCPYKVRRFNWFEYDRDDKVANQQLNPDVAVRSRGVMEKCTFCIQRISEARARARQEGRPVQDGEVVPACAQSCPTSAIVFGDENDTESMVSQQQKDERSYWMLSVVSTQPSVHYQTWIRNPLPAASTKEEARDE